MNSQELNPSDFVAEEHVELRNVIWEYYSEDLIAAQNDEVLIYSSHSMSQNSTIASAGEGKEVLPLEFAQLSMCSTETDDKDKELSEQTSAKRQQNSPMRSLHSDDGSTSPELSDLLDFVIDSEPNMEKRPSLDACRDTSEKKRKDENENLLQSSSMMLVAPPACRPNYPAKPLNYRTLANHKMLRVTDMCGTSQDIVRWAENNYGNFKHYPIPCLPPSMINHRLPTIDFKTDIIQFRPIGLNNSFLQPTIPTDNLKMNQIHSISTIPNSFPDIPKKDITPSNVVCQYISRKNLSSNLNNVTTISSCVIVSNRLTSPFGPRPIFRPASLPNGPQNVMNTLSSSPFKHSGHILPEVTVHKTSPNHTYQQSIISSAPSNGPQNVVNTTSFSPFKHSGHILLEVTVHKTSPNHTYQQSIISSAPSNGPQNVVNTTSFSPFKHSGHILPEVTVHKTSPNHTYQQSIISSAPSNGPQNVVNTTSFSPFKHSGHILPEVTVHKTSPNHTYQQSIISSAPSNGPQNVVNTTSCSPFKHSGHILPDVTVHKTSPNLTYQQSIISSAPSNGPQNVVNTMSSSPFEHSGHILPDVTVHKTSPNLTYQQSIISSAPSNGPQNVVNTMSSSPFEYSGHIFPEVTVHKASPNPTYQPSIISSALSNAPQNVVNTMSSSPFKYSGHILPEVTVHKASPNPTYQQSIISSAPSNAPQNVVNTTSCSPFKHSGHILPEVTVLKASPNPTYQQSIISSATSNAPQNVLNTMYSSPFIRHSGHIFPEVTVHKVSPNPTYQPSIISSSPSNGPQNFMNTLSSSPFKYSGHILPEVSVHKASPNPTYQQSIISSAPSNAPQNVVNTIFNSPFKRSYLTLPDAISHTGPLHSSHPQNMIPSTQENMHHGVVNTITSLPQKQSEQTDVSLQTAPLHHQIGTNGLQLNGQQPPPLARPMVPFKSTTKKSSKVQKVSYRENGRVIKRRRGLTKPSKKRATKKAAGKKPATRAKTQPLRMAQGQPPQVPTFPQVQPMSMAPAQHLEELIAVRENVQKNLKQFLCADSNCDDTTCFIARKYQNHALTCKHWYVANRCYLCWYISGTMDHAGKCEDFTCGSIFCKSKQAHTILESFSDPDFVRGFLRRLNVSEEEINETHVIKNRNNLSS